MSATKTQEHKPGRKVRCVRHFSWTMFSTKLQELTSSRKLRCVRHYFWTMSATKTQEHKPSRKLYFVRHFSWTMSATKTQEHKLSTKLKWIDDTLLGEVILAKLFYLPSKKVYAKRKEFHLKGRKFLSFRVDHFRRDLVCRKANRKSQKLYQLVEIFQASNLLNNNGRYTIFYLNS